MMDFHSLECREVYKNTTFVFSHGCVPALLVQDGISSAYFNLQKYTSFASSRPLLKKYTFSIKVDNVTN